MEIRMTSAAFEAGGMIPIQYTCDGQDISPPLSWGDVPEGSASIALVCDDPDAPVGTWVHWVLFDLPPETRNLPENIPAVENLENGGRHGTNDWHKLGYGGPCPPGGDTQVLFQNLRPGQENGSFGGQYKGSAVEGNGRPYLGRR